MFQKKEIRKVKGKKFMHTKSSIQKDTGTMPKDLNCNALYSFVIYFLQCKIKDLSGFIKSIKKVCPLKLFNN